MSPFRRFSSCRSFRFVFSGVAVVLLTATASTQAQTPTFDFTEYSEYNANADDVALSFADRVARRSAAATVDAERSIPAPRNVQNTSTKQNTPDAQVLTRRPAVSPSANVRPTDAPRSRPKSQAARTWEAFLFGTPKRPVSPPKFAFARRAVDSPIRVERSLPSVASPTTQPAQPTQPLQADQPSRPAQAAQPSQTAQTSVPTTDAEIAAARRRRLQELNALLASRRPEEFSRRLALNAAANVDAPTLAPVDAENNEYAENAELFGDAPALPILVADPSAERSKGVLQNRAELASDAAPFAAARANRPKIRQAANFEPAEPAPLELADDGFATFLLPTRPNALRLSPNVFLSTDLVRLPSAAPLREASENAQVAQTTQNSQTSRPEPSVQPARPLQNAQTPATVATPLPAAEPSTDVPTLRPTAQFVEPRFLPIRR